MDGLSYDIGRHYIIALSAHSVRYICMYIFFLYVQINMCHHLARLAEIIIVSNCAINVTNRVIPTHNL